MKPNETLTLAALKREIDNLRTQKGRRLSMHEFTDQLLRLNDLLSKAHDAGLSAGETIRLARLSRANDNAPADTNP